MGYWFKKGAYYIECPYCGAKTGGPYSSEFDDKPCSSCQRAAELCEAAFFKPRMSEATREALIKRAAGFTKRVQRFNSRTHSYAIAGLMRRKGEPSPHFRFQFKVGKYAHCRRKSSDAAEVEEKLTKKLLNAGAEEWQIVPSLPSADELSERLDEHFQG